MKKLVVVMLLALFCQSGIVLLAQTQYGTISGQIEDPSGAVVPNATILLTNAVVGFSLSSTSNDMGVYLLPNIAIGEYDLTVEVPGFQKYIHKLKMTVADRTVIDVHLEIGSMDETIYVEASDDSLNMTSGDLSTTMSNGDIQLLPLLDRNPYRLISLVPAASNTGASSGDTYGLGLTIAGTRNRSINFMLDGGENNETFLATVVQSVPQDAVAEFRVTTNNMTAEFGRNPVTANVVTKSGGNDFHGSLYEFYRGSGLSAWNYDDKAAGNQKSRFVRNQFGASLGGPIVKDKTFFFGSFEGIIVRSNTSRPFYVPTQEFIAAAAPNAREFIQGFGDVPTGDPNYVVTAQQVVENVEGGDYLSMPLLDYSGDPLAADTPLFSRFLVEDPADAGGGASQDTFLATGRIDHSFSSKTQFFGRFAYQQSSYPDGSVSISPFTDFNTDRNQRYQNYALSLTHTLSPTLFSDSRVVYNRIYENQPAGKAPITTPCWDYFTQNDPSGIPIVFPGYLPTQCSNFAVPAGGPQNVYQFYEGMIYSRGIHSFKWGGQYIHIRDNRTFGAGQSGWFPTLTMQGMLNGIVDGIQLAIDPQDKVPGDVYDTSLDGPFGSPNSTRHHRYNEFALYFEDSIRVTRRLNLTLGLRWEYFGVLHSPENEKHLDANLFLNALDSSDPDANAYEQVRDARFSRTDNLYDRDFTNFAPRFGFAYDLLGDGNTVLRGGYGLYYNRNFGNALYNVMLNFPNYAILQLEPYGSGGGPQIPVELNQFDTLNSYLTDGQVPLSGPARMLDRGMKTAYSTQWNLTLEHNILGKGIIGSASYIGNYGNHLYSLNNPNKAGSCLLDPSINEMCSPVSRLNQTGLTDMNRRANEGFSRYHAMALELRAPRIGETGINIKGNYTWAHLIDNASSELYDSAFEKPYGYGFRDPYKTALDRTSSTNDIRHRLNIYGMWTTPFAKNGSSWQEALLQGWTISGIFQAQTGTAFSVYDDGPFNLRMVGSPNFNYPILSGPVPERTETAGSDPNRFVLYDNLDAALTTQFNYCEGNPMCVIDLANTQAEILSPRNLFRTPGIWNFDMSVVKEFTLSKEGVKLRFNADFLNIFNHANLYAFPGSNDFRDSSSQVLARKGIDPSDRKEQRNIQLAIRLLF